MTKPTVSYGHGLCHDLNSLTDWDVTQDGNVGTTTILYDDWFDINITGSSGNKVYYRTYWVNLLSDTYTTIYYRYRTEVGSSIKAKIALTFSVGDPQTVLAETSSTTWKTGFVYITSGKTITSIRLYANQSTGHVYYDFVLICKGIFTFPNTQGGAEFVPPPRNVDIGIPSRLTDVIQNLGSPNAIWIASCDLDLGSWKRSGDYVKGEVFLDISHNSYREPFQWLDTGEQQFKVTLDALNLPKHSDSHILDLTLKEYSRSSKSNESYVERFGLNL